MAAAHKAIDDAIDAMDARNTALRAVHFAQKLKRRAASKTMKAFPHYSCSEGGASPRSLPPLMDTSTLLHPTALASLATHGTGKAHEHPHSARVNQEMHDGLTPNAIGRTTSRNWTVRHPEPPQPSNSKRSVPYAPPQPQPLLAAHTRELRAPPTDFPAGHAWNASTPRTVTPPPPGPSRPRYELLSVRQRLRAPRQWEVDSIRDSQMQHGARCLDDYWLHHREMAGSDWQGTAFGAPRRKLVVNVAGVRVPALFSG
jgi:hypothetical protein